MNQYLDSKQMEVLEAVRPTKSRVFVEGGPGTGKTTTALAAANDVLRDSRDGGNSRALFVAFSRSAVAQIATNLMHLHSADGDRIEITTLDALALRIISGYGRYHGRGASRPTIQSAASAKVSGIDDSRYQYDKLIPLAVSILTRSQKISALIKSRWCIVVCDEFQDISSTQLEFVELLCGNRLLLLGDRDQHIYGWRGADIRQFNLAKSECEFAFNLGEGSYRDPSLEFPKLASAFRLGDPIDHHLDALTKSGRLQIKRVEDDIVEDIACSLAISQHTNSHIAIFAHHIETVTALGERMSASGAAYEIAGTSEVYAEALEAMLTMCLMGLGIKTIEDVGLAFASVCASLHRGRGVPDICWELKSDGYTDSVAARCYLLARETLSKKVGGRMGDVVQLVSGFWRTLNLGLADAQWDRASRELRRCAESLTDEAYSEPTVEALALSVETSRNRYLLNSQLDGVSQITLLTYNQSKGREFDVVIHAHKSDDYWGKRTDRDRKESLRVLGVAISRTRQKLIVVTPPNPHEIVRPFVV